MRVHNASFRRAKMHLGGAPDYALTDLRHPDYSAPSKDLRDASARRILASMMANMNRAIKSTVRSIRFRADATDRYSQPGIKAEMTPSAVIEDFLRSYGCVEELVKHATKVVAKELRHG